MRARYYNPYLCRFINSDPSGFSGGMNFYAYADGNPVSKIDPFGLGASVPNYAAQAQSQQHVIDFVNFISFGLADSLLGFATEHGLDGGYVNRAEAFEKTLHNTLNVSLIGLQVATGAWAAQVSTVSAGASVSFAGRAGGNAAKGIGTAEKFGIPKFLNPRQSIHMPPVTDGRSVLTANPSKLLEGVHDGIFTIMRQPKPGHVTVDFGKPIGEFWDQGVKVGDSSFGNLYYGKKGAHFTPANPIQW